LVPAGEAAANGSRVSINIIETSPAWRLVGVGAGGRVNLHRRPANEEHLRMADLDPKGQEWFGGDVFSKASEGHRGSFVHLESWLQSPANAYFLTKT
jgi:hypothetical protein